VRTELISNIVRLKFVHFDMNCLFVLVIIGLKRPVNESDRFSDFFSLLIIRMLIQRTGAAVQRSNRGNGNHRDEDEDLSHPLSI